MEAKEPIAHTPAPDVEKIKGKKLFFRLLIMRERERKVYHIYHKLKQSFSLSLTQLKFLNVINSNSKL